MAKRKGVKKRYLITVSSIFLAVFSVLFLRFFEKDFFTQKTMVEKELKAIMEFNKDIFVQNDNADENEKAKILRDKFAGKISYKELFGKKEDFKNFKYLPDKAIYGLKLLNNAHVGFYYNSQDCGNINENKDYCAGAIVDINGYTRPNRFGQDQFLFKIYKNGFVE